MHSFITSTALLTIAAAAAAAAENGDHPYGPQGSLGAVEQARPAVFEVDLQARALEMVNELSNRRRLNYLFPNPQIPDNGVQKSYVNVGTGNLTFIQRDLVRADRVPIVAGRVYDSRIVDGADFGPGWKLTMSELIVPENGNVFVYTDGNNNSYRMQLDGRNLIADKSAPLAIKSKFLSDDVIEITDHRLRRIFKRNDNRFLLSRIEDRSGNLIFFEYSNGRMSLIRTGNDRFINLIRDDSNRIISIMDDVGQKIDYEYSVTGTLESASLLHGARMEYRYDARNLLVEVIDPRGVQALAATHDANRRAVRISVLANSFEFDFKDNKTTVTDGIGASTTFLQDSRGPTTTVIDTLGNRSHIKLDDARGEPIELSLNGTTLARLAYQESGALAEAIYTGTDRKTEMYFQYFPAGKLRSLVVDGTEMHRFSYNPHGRLLRSGRPDGEELSIEWGPGNQPKGFQLAGSKFDVEEDEYGRVTQFSSHAGSYIKIDYDDFDRVISIDTGSNGSATYSYSIGKFRTAANYGRGNVTELRYDAAGSIRRVAYKDRGELVANDVYVVGNHNELKEIVSSTKPTFFFEYDQVGRATTVSAGDRHFEMQYDEHSRLIRTLLDGKVALERDYGYVDMDVGYNTDRKTFRSKVVQSMGSGIFGSPAEIVYTRPDYSAYQAVRFDSDTNRFLLRDIPDWHPERLWLDSLARTNLLHLAQEFDGRLSDFDKPTNALFIPPEYFSVNCLVCNDLIFGHELTVNGSQTAILSPGQSPTITSSALGYCKYSSGGGGPPPVVLHSIDTGAGVVASASIPGLLSFSPSGITYPTPGAYGLEATMACSCGILAYSLAAALVEVTSSGGCSNASRLAFHTADFIKNNHFDITNSGLNVSATIKVRPGPGALFSTFESATQSHWNKSFSGVGNLSFNFEEVDFLYFGNDTLDIETEAFPVSAPERGFADRGGKRLTYALTASSQVIAHEFGHILGFRDAYKTLANGFGEDLPCHTGDVMATASSGKTVRSYHAELLVAKY